MTHQWKVGDAYFTKDSKSADAVLIYFGIITEVDDPYSTSIETTYSIGGNCLYAVHNRVTHLLSDLVPLVPQLVRLDQTINEIYATVDKVMGEAE